MLTSPLYYYRNYSNDIYEYFRWQGLPKIKDITKISLTFLSLYSPIQKPLSIILSATRTISYLPSVYDNYINQKDNKKTVFSLYNVSIATAALSYALFNATKGLAISTVDDSIKSFQKTIFNYQKSKYQKAFRKSLKTVNNLLYLSLILSGRIEILVASLACQIILETLKSYKNLKNKDYLKAISHIAMATIRASILKPQAKLLNWKYSSNFECSGTLKQSKSGFIYVDIDDDVIKELNAYFKEYEMELPPYFKPNKTGGHISVILANEANKNNIATIDEIGKKIMFDICNFRTLKPEGWNIEEVSFITVNSNELENIRQKYNLSGKIANNHDFHITTGVKY